jgi:CBS domain-containing protein
MTRLREIIHPEFLTTVRRDATVAEAVRAMIGRNVGMVAVLDGDLLVGVFSERDVVRRVVDKGLDPGATRVAEVMTTDLVVAEADEHYRSAMSKMDQANIRHLPVVEDGRLLAMLSIRDLMRLEIHDRGEELRYLHEYLYHVPTDVAPAR